MSWYTVGETFPQIVPAHQTHFLFVDVRGIVHIGYVDLRWGCENPYYGDVDEDECCEEGAYKIRGRGYMVDNDKSFLDWTRLDCVCWCTIIPPLHISIPAKSELSPDQGPP